MRRAGMLAVTAAAVLLVAGCTQAPATDAVAPSTSSPTASPMTTGASREADAREQSQDRGVGEQERLFLESARLAEPDWTDEQLLEAGYEYCAGPRSTDVIEGVDAIITYAADQALCPD